jgi:hypothetical protein
MAHRSVQELAGTRAAIGFGSLLVIAALLAASCSGSAGSPLSAVGAPVKEPAAAATLVPAPAARDGALGSTNSGTTGGGTAQRGASAPDGSGPLIVRTGQLDLQVADIEAAIRAAESAVTAVGGYVAGSQRSGDADKASASVMFRSA